MTRQKSRPFRERDAAAEVREWRRHRLLDAGFPTELARAVSADNRYDLHALLQLVDRGCPPELAVRIEAPLPREVGR
jgi:hypothetical protein